MIGQETIHESLSNMIRQNKIPKFMLLQGSRGWGKKCLCREFAKMLDSDIVMFDNKVDSLRDCINLAYEQTTRIVYVLLDGDTMSTAAKNSILKLVEEPPTNAIIIMLVENEETILPTIKSRAFVIRMDRYTRDSILQYINQKETALTSQEIEKLADVCNCPGEVDLMLQPENAELISTVDKLVENVGKVTLSNLLKLSKKFKINESSEGIDVTLFLNCCQLSLFNKFRQTRDRKYFICYKQVVNTRKALRSNTTNKLYALDKLLTEMWKLWNCGN